LLADSELLLAREDEPYMLVDFPLGGSVPRVNRLLSVDADDVLFAFSWL